MENYPRDLNPIVDEAVEINLNIIVLHGMS